MRLTRVDGRWYLEGWCHVARDTRLFRLDRIERLDVLEEDGFPPADARPRDLTHGPFRIEDAGLCAQIDLDAEASWVLDYYPHEGVAPGQNGTVRVEIAASEPDWILRLLLRLGGHGRLVGPPDLVARLRERTAAALSLYGTPVSSE